MMPKAKIVRRRNMPPLNMSMKPKNVLEFCWKNASSLFASIPGVGICAPRRYTASKPSVKNTRRRRSGTRKMFATASKNLFMTLLLRGHRRFDDPFDRTAGGDYLFFRLGREQMRLHVNLAIQLTGGEDLETVVELLQNAGFVQRFGAKAVAIHFGEPADIDNREMLLEYRVGKPTLG